MEFPVLGLLDWSVRQSGLQIFMYQIKGILLYTKRKHINMCHMQWNMVISETAVYRNYTLNILIILLLQLWKLQEDFVSQLWIPVEWFIIFAVDRFHARTSYSLWRRKEWTNMSTEPLEMGIQYDNVDLVIASSPPPPPPLSITPSPSPSAQHIETAPNCMEYNV